MRDRRSRLGKHLHELLVSLVPRHGNAFNRLEDRLPLRVIQLLPTRVVSSGLRSPQIDRRPPPSS